MAVCPHCKQPIAVARLGVRLPPFKARLIDLLRQAGDIGASSEELRGDLYRGYARYRSVLSVKAHVWQINEILEETDWRIVSDGRGRFARWYLREVAR
jgi:hypothetical protein